MAVRCLNFRQINPKFRLLTELLGFSACISGRETQTSSDYLIFHNKGEMKNRQNFLDQLSQMQQIKASLGDEITLKELHAFNEFDCE
jgi:hypothetical protein